MGLGGQGHAAAALPTGNTRYPLYEAGWAPGPVWTGVENLASPSGFDLRTVQPVASRYGLREYIKVICVFVYIV